MNEIEKVVGITEPELKNVLVTQGIFKNSLVRPPLLPISRKEKEEIYALVSAVR